jgi:ABC-type bacteriocin/lantibiotic exporter with double-glycine peptidase domain
LKSIFLLIILTASLSAHVIDGVPFVKQETLYCGPASLSSVMAFYGAEADQQEIGKIVYSDAIKSSLITDLENFARQRGFETKLNRGGAEDLKNLIDQKKPVIVLVDLGIWVVSRPHYLVVFGYNSEGFIAHDGYKAAELFNYEKFDAAWEKMGRSYLLIYK